MPIASTIKRRNNEESLVIFSLNQKFFAIENTYISQIIQNAFINPAANTPPYLLGSTAYQGEVLPAIDLNIYFYGERLDSLNDNPRKTQNFLVAEYGGQSIFLLVDNVIGIISKPGQSVTKEIFINSKVKSESFFNSAFMWEENIIVMLNIEMIFNQIMIDSNKHFKNSQIEITFQNYQNGGEVPLDEFNIELQHNQDSTQVSRWRPDRFIRPAKEEKFTGTIVNVQNLSILIPNENLSGIYSISQLTEIPNTSNIVVGAINYQGEVINAIDLTALLFTDQTTKINDNQKFTGLKSLIVEFAGEKLAFMMDEIPRIVEVEKSEIRQTLVLNTGINDNYIFQGVMLEQSGNIVFVLNINYIFRMYFNTGSLEDENYPVVSFYNPMTVTAESVKSRAQEGLLVQNKENLFFIDSEFITQILDQVLFFRSEYSHEAILGVTTHRELSPLVDFNYLVQGACLGFPETSKVAGVLLHDQKTDLEAAFVVEKILGRVSIDQLDIFQPETSFYTSMLSQMISGFFSFNGALGIIVKPARLLEETFSILKSDIGINNVEEMISQLNPDDEKSLAQLQDQHKERELYLLSHGEEDRCDFLVFRWGGDKLAIDVSFIQSVLSSSVKIKKSRADLPPHIKKATLGEEEICVIDLQSLMMKTPGITNYDEEVDFFTVKIEDETYQIPVESLEAVITAFKSDFHSLEGIDIFSEGIKCCQQQFIDEKDSSSVFIIENEFIEKTLTGEILKSPNNDKITNKTK